MELNDANARYCSVCQTKHKQETQILRKKRPCLELFWSVFSRIRTEYGEILRISPYSVRMRENTDQNNSEYGHFLHSEKTQKKSNLKGNLKIKRNRITIFIYCCLSGITSTTNSRQKLTETF